MRKKPTPRSLKLTKTTCDNLYRKGCKDWTMCSFDVVDFYTNGHVATRHAPMVTRDALKYISTDVNRGRLDLMIDQKGSYYFPVTTTGEVEIRESDDEPPLSLVRFSDNVTTGGVITALVQECYASLVTWMYPGATWLMEDQTRPIKVINGDQLVAVVMPVRP